MTESKISSAIQRIGIRGGLMIVSLGFATLLAFANVVRAGTLYVPNASFELPQTDFALPELDSWAIPPQPQTFDTNVFGPWYQLAGVFENTPATNADHIQGADGNQLAYLFAYPQMAIFQDYTTTNALTGTATHAFNAIYEPGMTYTLTVGVTGSTDEPLTQGSTLEAGLYYVDSHGNMVTVAATNITYDTNVFTNLTELIYFPVMITVGTNDAWAGQHIGIEFESTVSPNLIGGVWDLDNVRLTDSVYVPNASFESPQTTFAIPEVDSWQIPPQPQTFDTNIFGPWYQLAGVFDNTPATNADHIQNADGNQLAYLFAYPQMALFQDYDSTNAFDAAYQPGMSYTLTVGLTSSSDEPLTPGSTLLVSLYYRDASSNMVTVAVTNVTYNTNVFTNLTRLTDVSVTLPNVSATDPWAGQHIGIEFESTVSPDLIGGVWDLDNVRLSTGVAPAIVNPVSANGQFGFTLQSEPGLVFQILAATNVTQPSATWASLAKVTNVTGAFSFSDTTTNPPPQRFYKAVQSP